MSVDIIQDDMDGMSAYAEVDRTTGEFNLRLTLGKRAVEEFFQDYVAEYTSNDFDDISIDSLTFTEEGGLQLIASCVPK